MKVSLLSTIRSEELDPVLEEETGHWEKELFWDFRPTADLIKRYVKNRCLRGTAVTSSKGDLLGYEYHVADPPVGFLGDVYVLNRHAEAQIYKTLVCSALSDLEENPGVGRIECQLFPFNFDVTDLLVERGFSARERLYLARSLVETVESATQGGPSGTRLIPWSSAYFDAAAEVVHDSYQDSDDRELCLDYQTRLGCRRFLRNLIDSHACGKFQADTSLIAAKAQGEIAAVLLSSLVHRDCVMVPQLSVGRRFQRQGLGTLMMGTFLRRARSKGWKTASLSVSVANHNAVRLYNRLDFKKAKAFRAYVRSSARD